MTMLILVNLLALIVVGGERAAEPTAGQVRTTLLFAVCCLLFAACSLLLSNGQLGALSLLPLCVRVVRTRRPLKLLLCQPGNCLCQPACVNQSMNKTPWVTTNNNLLYPQPSLSF